MDFSLRMVASGFLLAWVLLVISVSVPAQVMPREVRDAIEFPLPAVEEVLGLQPTPAPRVLVMIGDANAGETDCDLKTLGAAVGTTLRVRAFGLSSAISFGHPMAYWSDSTAEPEVVDLNPDFRVARRIGATHVLRSHARAQDGVFHLRLELVDVRNGKVLASSERSSDQPESVLAEMLPEALAPLSFTVVSSEMSRLRDWQSAPPGPFLALHQAFANSCDGKGFAEQIERAWKGYMGAPILAAMYARKIDGPEALQKLDAIPASAMHEPVVDLMASLSRINARPGTHGDGALERLKHLVARYPQEPGAWDALIDGLSSVPQHVRTIRNGCDTCEPVPERHHAHYAQAVALVLTSLRRWPDNYRGWWGLSYALDRYAGAVRGWQYHREMEEQARRRYPKLLDLAGRAARQALDAHSGQPSLYAIRIDVNAGMGEDWYGTFLAGIGAAPHARILYDKAMNYSRDAWGGNAKKRERIWRLARNNNPDASWPDEVYRYSAPGMESTSRIYRRPVGLTLLVVIGIGFVAFWYRGKAQP